MSKVIDRATAAGLVRDGQSVASLGVIGWCVPDAILRALGERFEATGHPTDVSFFFPVATGDARGIGGMDHVAKRGLMRRIIAGSYINPVHPRTGARPAVMELIRRNEVEAYNWPIGAAMHWLREVARRGPGYLTRVGLGTFADPRHHGGRLTARAKEDLVQLVQLRGEEYLFYPSWPLDVGIIRASSADHRGNLSFEDMPLTSAALALALAVKASGGTVIAQVSRLAPKGSRPAREVRIPAPLVDHVVVADGEPWGTDVHHDPGYLGQVADPVRVLPRIPFSARKIVARRVAREVRRGETSILGFGMASDAILTMAEDGMLTPDNLDDYVFTTEHGPFGGVVMGGWQFSANYSPVGLLDGPSQFDFIDGGGCDFAALSFAQFDRDSRVNVTRFDTSNPGAGGFADIAQNTRRVVFAGTLTAGGLEIDCADGRLRIVREGKHRKLVPQVDAVTYQVGDGVRRGQHARLITERAVFDITGDGLEVVEVAPGIDVERDLLAQVGFPVRWHDDVATMDAALFAD